MNPSTIFGKWRAAFIQKTSHLRQTIQESYTESGKTPPIQDIFVSSTIQTGKNRGV